VQIIYGQKLLEFRNPWGAGEWTGDWGDKSDKWYYNPLIKEALGFTGANDDGCFYMAYEDF